MPANPGFDLAVTREMEHMKEDMRRDFQRSDDLFTRPVQRRPPLTPAQRFAGFLRNADYRHRVDLCRAYLERMDVAASELCDCDGW